MGSRCGRVVGPKGSAASQPTVHRPKLNLSSCVAVGIRNSFGESRPNGLGRLRLFPQVEPGAERRVEVAQRLGAVLLLDSDACPYADPAFLVHHLPVLLRQISPLIEDGEAHHVERGVGVTNLLDLEHPPGCHPCPRAERVEPEIYGCRHAVSYTHLTLPTK